MIRIPLLGRTGNNLFQYALGRTLAERRGVPLLLDASLFNADGWNQVSHFLNTPISAKVRREPSLASRALRKFTGKHYWEYSRGPVKKESPDDHSFDPSFLDAPPECVLFGYFQSPLYFESISELLRDEINTCISGATTVEPNLAEQLSAPSSVAVHVRRTDYLVQPAFNICGDGYYRNAISHLRTLLKHPRFFIFSDDPAWCRSKFTAPDQIVLDTHSVTSNPLHDLHLMSLASHHIIANSSYSWWAAWLGKKFGQEVVMPDRWFTSGIKAPIEEKNPGGWIVLPTQES